MLLLLDEYKRKLVNQILLATSQSEVQHFIDTAIEGLLQKNTNSDVVFRFIERMSNDLALFDPLKNDAQQWSNIKMAMILFNRIHNKLLLPAH
jgi:hypothetical protein